MPTLARFWSPFVGRFAFHERPASKRRDRKVGAPALAARQRHRDPELDRARDPLVADELALAISTHGVALADLELLETEERSVRELQRQRPDDLCVEPRQAPRPLQLEQPRHEARTQPVIWRSSAHSSFLLPADLP